MLKKVIKIVILFMFLFSYTQVWAVDVPTANATKEEIKKYVKSVNYNIPDDVSTNKLVNWSNTYEVKKADKISKAIITTLKNKSANKITKYIDGLGNKNSSDDDLKNALSGKNIKKSVLEAWKSKLEAEKDDNFKKYITMIDGIVGDASEDDDESAKIRDTQSYSQSSDTDTSLDGTITQGDTFIKKGELSEDSNGKFVGTINGEKFKANVKTIYNILFVLAVVISVIIIAIIGIKIMTGSVEEKAEIKEQMVPYIIGIGIAFGGFTIWRIAMIVLGSM